MRSVLAGVETWAQLLSWGVNWRSEIWAWQATERPARLLILSKARDAELGSAHSGGSPSRGVEVMWRGNGEEELLPRSDYSLG